MGFLSGPATFDCFRINDSGTRQFGPEHIKALERHAIGRIETSSTEQADVGFLAGGHLFDLDFSLEKNVIADALHRDSDQHQSDPGRGAQGMAANGTGPVDRRKSQWTAHQGPTPRSFGRRRGPLPRRGQERSVPQNAAVPGAVGRPAASAVFRRLEFHRQRTLLRPSLASVRSEAGAADGEPPHPGVGGGIQTAPGVGCDYPFRIPRRRSFVEIAWWNNESGNYDFLGNEFLLWLWWQWATHSDTVELPDGSEVTGMFARTLSLECPREESGKETIVAESPVRLPEAAQAIRSGKLPRKGGLTLVRHGQQYKLVLQAETFVVSGAKIRAEETAEAAEGRGILEDRIDSLRDLHATVELLFQGLLPAADRQGLVRRTERDTPLAEGGGNREKARNVNPAGATWSATPSSCCYHPVPASPGRRWCW